LATRFKVKYRGQNWGYYFKAEAVTNSEFVKEANEKINKQCSDLELKVFDNNAFWKLLESLNSRKGFRFNLDNQDFK